MFTIHPRTKSYVPCSVSSTFVVIQQKYDVRVATMVLFCMLHKYYPLQTCKFFQGLSQEIILGAQYIALMLLPARKSAYYPCY